MVLFYSNLLLVLCVGRIAVSVYSKILVLAVRLSIVCWWPVGRQLTDRWWRGAIITESYALPVTVDHLELFSSFPMPLIDYLS